MKLSRYALGKVATDKLKRNRFKRGLKLEIKETLVVRPPTYKNLLEMAIRAEEIIIEKTTLTAKRKRVTGTFIAPF